MLRPDTTNLCKAVEDALWKEDSVIYGYDHLYKFWSDEGGIMIFDSPPNGYSAQEKILRTDTQQ